VVLRGDRGVIAFLGSAARGKAHAALDTPVRAAGARSLRFAVLADLGDLRRVQVLHVLHRPGLRPMAATQDDATRTAVGEARTALAAVLTLNGVVISGGSKVRGTSVNGGTKPDAERVARYIADHPGSRAEDIATALGTETAQLRPALMKLRSAGAVEPKGKARATRYYASAS
jgi:hypothetical protein